MKAQEFRYAREKQGLNQAEIAGILEVTPITIHRWESGKTEIPRAVELAVAAIIGDKVQELDTVLRQLYIDALADTLKDPPPPAPQEQAPEAVEAPPAASAPETASETDESSRFKSIMEKLR